MKKVLLAIVGQTPDQEALRYAVGLCRRIRHDLSVFQIVRPSVLKGHRENLKEKACKVRRLLEEAMVAATYAEAGDQKTAIDIIEKAAEPDRHSLAGETTGGVRCQYSMRAGNPEEEIVDYVRSHRDVVLTIYDEKNGDSETTVKRKNGRTFSRIARDLTVPVVTVQH